MSDTLTIEFGGNSIVVNYGENAAAALMFAQQAEASATAADASATAAAASANLAEAAALTTGNVYATKAAGIAATANGETFWSDEDVPLGLYRNVAGVATLLDEFVAQSTIDHFFTYQATLTVGTDQPTLMAALDVVEKRNLRQPVTIQLPAQQETAAVTIDIAGLTLQNPRMDLVVIKGAAGYTTMTDTTGLTGVEANDLNVMRSKMPSVVLIDGDDTVASGTNINAGLEALAGISFDQVGIHDKARYGIGSGYKRSHANAGVGGRLSFNNVIALGGVWGLFGYAATILLTGNNLIGRAKSGAPIGAFHSRIEMPTGTHTFYAPDVTVDADGPKYMLVLYGPSAYVELGAGATLNMDGRAVHGFWMRGGAQAQLLGTVNITKVTQPITLMDGSGMFLGGATTISGADPTKTALVTGADQWFEPGNTPTGALIHVGAECHLAHNGITASNVVGNCALRLAGGRMNSYNPVAVSDYAFSGNFADIWSSHGNTGALRGATPKGTNGATGTRIYIPDDGSIVFFEDPTANGLTVDPALTVPRAGRWKMSK